MVKQAVTQQRAGFPYFPSGHPLFPQMQELCFYLASCHTRSPQLTSLGPDVFLGVFGWSSGSLNQPALKPLSDWGNVRQYMTLHVGWCYSGYANILVQSKHLCVFPRFNRVPVRSTKITSKVKCLLVMTWCPLLFLQIKVTPYCFGNILRQN